MPDISDIVTKGDIDLEEKCWNCNQGFHNGKVREATPGFDPDTGEKCSFCNQGWQLTDFGHAMLVFVKRWTGVDIIRHSGESVER